jgi:hypothetical protein
MNDLFDFELNESEGYWIVTGYCGRGEEVIFPASYRNKPVKAIGGGYSSNANNKRIKRVIIPVGYDSIGDGAFYGCTGLTNIKLPKSLITIGDVAFESCTELTEIKLPESLTSIGGGTFRNCTRLTEIILPESLTSIGELAFCDCTGLTDIKLPKSLTSIGRAAFYGCTGLTDIKLPESLTSIGEDAFYGCIGITDITVEENNPAFRSIDGVLFDKAMTTLLLFHEGKKGRYSVPDGIIKIGSGAFYGCRELIGISFPQSLSCIESYGFNNEQLTEITVNELNPKFCSIDGVLFDKKMSELMEYPKNRDETDYTVPDGIKHIKDRAFYGCKRLVNIVLPESLKVIGNFKYAKCEDPDEILALLRALKEGVFEKCPNLETVTLSRKTKIGYKAFEGFKGRLVYIDDLFDFEFNKNEKCWSVTGYYGKSEEVVFPASYKGKPVKKIACFFPPNQQKRIKRVIIPEGYTSIEHEVFGDCKGLTNIKFPKTLTSIGTWAFYGCEGLTSIELPENLTSIGGAAFARCTGLTNIKIPKSLTSIEDDAFSGCAGLTSIELPEGLTCVEGGVFSGCTGLTNINFPKSLISIDGRTNKSIIKDGSGCCTFADCTGLTNIELPEGLTFIGEKAFRGCTGLINLKLPKSLTSIEGEAFSGCTGLTNIKLPERLDFIDDNAFEGCTGLTNIELPESLNSIGNAFKDCTGLTNIKLPKSLTSIGDQVFEGCKNLAEITVDKNNPAFCAIDGVMFDKAMTTLLWFPEGKKGRYAIPDGITGIKIDAFGNDCRLTSISFPKSFLYFNPYSLDQISDNLTDIAVSELNPVCCSIDGVLFDKDKSELILYPRKKGKTTYIIPDGIQSIGDDAFNGCKRLVNIVLPESIRSIGDYAFEGCKRLKTITLSNKLRYAIEYVISDRKKFQKIFTSLSGNPKIGRKAFGGFEGQFVYRD